MTLIKATRPSARLAAVTAYADVDMVDMTISAANGADVVVEVVSQADPFRLIFPVVATEWHVTVDADVDNYGRIEAAVASGIVSGNGSLALDEGVIEHNYTGNTAPNDAGGGGGGLSGVSLEMDVTAPDSPVLQMKQGSTVVASAALPKASPSQGGIIESDKFIEIGNGADMDGGTF